MADKNRLPRELIRTAGDGKAYLLAELQGTGWSLMNSKWFFCLERDSSGDSHVFKLTGDRQVSIFYPSNLIHSPYSVSVELLAKKCLSQRSNDDATSAFAIYQVLPQVPLCIISQ